MGLNYKVEKKAFGFDPDKTERYVATAVRGDTVSFDRVVEQISLRSGLAKPVCKAVVETLIDSAATWMLEGHGVSLGNIGYLKPAITSKSSEVEGGEKILKKRVLFLPSKSFRDLIERMPISRIAADTGSGSATNPTEPGGDGGEGGEDGGGGGFG